MINGAYERHVERTMSFVGVGALVLIMTILVVGAFLNKHHAKVEPWINDHQPANAQ